MKLSASALSQPLSTEKSWVSVFADLFKARLSLLVLLTTLAGYYAGCRGALDYLVMLHTAVGTALLAAGAAALNQLLERDLDARMRRTQERPLPTGRLQAGTVLALGSGLAAFGLAYLGLAVNVLASLVGALTLFLYLFVYTPLKQQTWLNTIAGAIPGALPPLIGWVAARGSVGIEGLALVLIQALWQIPHFMAIAWLYRDDYAQAGFKMLPCIDPTGRRTARLTLTTTGLLLAASLLPYWLALAGTVYLVGALLLGAGFTCSAWAFGRHLSDLRARRLFLVSVLYLPVLFSLLVFDKLKS
jgi:protoheme IX farnesyltransferase